MKTISNGRQPQNINSEYLSNHLLDHTQILNLSLYDQTILCKGRPPPMEDALKILKWNISATTYWILLKF
jgi:hypothetical protein